MTSPAPPQRNAPHRIQIPVVEAQRSLSIATMHLANVQDGL